MTLMTSGRATGRRCPVCGSQDGSCGGAHAQTEGNPVDAPIYAEGSRSAPVDVIAERVINGHRTQVLANSDQAEAEGWPIVSAIGGGPFHKKRPAPQPPAPAAPATAKPKLESSDPEPEDGARRAYLESLPKPDVYDIAADLDIAGRSSMGKPALIEAIIEAEG